MQEGTMSRRRWLWLAALLLLLMALALSLASILRRGPANEPSTLPTATATAAPASRPTLPPATPAATAANGGLTTAVVSGGRSSGDPYTPELGNSGYEARRYAITLALDPATTYVAGATTIDAVTTWDNLGQFSLDFIGFTISSLTIDGVTAVFAREGDKLIITLPQPLPAGTPFSLVVAYEGEPEQRTSPYLGIVSHLGLNYTRDNSLFVIAEPDGARFWFPANDHPRDKATFRFELTVPQGLTAVANGRLIGVRQGERMPDGQVADTFVWEHNYPMATYLAVAAVGRYERLESSGPDGLLLRDYVFPELRADFLRATAVTGEALAWMSDLLGPYPFEEYGHVTVYVPNVSMETQTMVLLSERMMTESTVLHELAHVWFGNWVSLDSWGDMWRNEGFATYFTLLWETRHDSEMLALQMAALETAVAEQQSPYPLDNLPPELLFSFDTYLKGAVVVHNLRLEMGDAAFFSGLRAYFEQYGGGAASHAQFQAVMEEAAGFSLDEFFAEWFE